MKKNFIFLVLFLVSTGAVMASSKILENKELVGIMLSMVVCLIAVFIIIITIKYLPTLVGFIIKLAKILFQIWKLKKNGFSYTKKIMLADGKILFYSLKFNNIKEIYNYYKVIITDKNFNIINSEIFGIGDDVEYNDNLIRVVTVVDNNFTVGFLNRKTGKISISYQFERAKPFFKYCETKTDGYVKEYSTVYFPGKVTPNYIDTTGKLINDKNFFGYPQTI